MKRIGSLWHHIVCWDNLLLAFRRARRGKASTPAVLAFEFELEKALLNLKQALDSGEYRPGSYRLFTLYERKPRQIAAAPFIDRVVHHAIMNVIEPPLDRRFIFDSYACRRNKGVHAAVTRYQQFARRFDYVFKLDISKYFASIDHGVLKSLLRERIKDSAALALLDLIIDSSPDLGGSGPFFPGDDLLTATERRCGIPIGNLTSQFFANLYLDDFDHWLKQDKRLRGYIRYVDDLFLFANDKAFLWQLQQEIALYMEQIRLVVHPRKIDLRRTTERIDVLGYLASRQRRWLRNDNGYRARRRLTRLSHQYARGRVDFNDVTGRIHSWIGHAMHAETEGLRQSLFDGLSFQRGWTRDDAPRVARRLVEQQPEEVALRQPQQQRC